MAVTGSGASTAYWSVVAPQTDSPRPLWVSSWSKGTSNTGANQEWAGFAAAGDTDPIVMTYFDASGGLNLLCSNNAFTLNQYGASGTSNGVWHHILGTVSAASLVLYRDGTSVASGSNTLASPQTLDTLVINKTQSTASCPTSRSFAEVVFGRGTLTTAQVTALSRGASPLTVCAPGQILAYYPLRNDLLDYGPSRLPLSAFGGLIPTWAADHPSVALPSRLRRFFKAAAVAPALASTISTVSTVSAELTTQIRAAAAPSAVSTVSAALTTQIPLAAASTVGSTLTAGLTTAITPSAGLSAVSVVTGGLTTAIPLSAAAASVSTIGAALTTSIVLVAAPSAITTVTATMAGSSAALAAGLAASSGLAADLTTVIALSASVAGSSTATASLTTSIRLSLALNGAATVAANLTTAIPLTAGIAGGTTVSAALSTDIGLASAIQIGSTFTADLTTSIRLLGTLIANSQIVADLATILPPPSVIDIGHVISFAADSRTAGFTTDSRLATVPLDSRTVTLPGNA